MRVVCDDTANLRGEHELTVEEAQPLDCGCIRLVTTRPGEPTTGRSRDMHVIDTAACAVHEETGGPVLVSRGSLTIRHTRPEGTVLTGASRRGGADMILKPDFRFSRTLGAWYIQGSRDRAADLWKIGKAVTALRASLWTVAIEIDETPRAFTEAEGERYDRAEERATYHDDVAGRAVGRSDARWNAARQIRDRMPPGQPVLAGHHSEGKHRRDLARADSHERAFVEEAGRADYHANRAQAAARYETGRKDVPTTLRRIKELKARVGRIERNLAGRIIGPLTWEETAWRDARQADLVQLADEIAHWEKHVAEREAAGEKVWGPPDFQAGDIVYLGVISTTVVRVNAKSLTVKALIGDHVNWNDRIPYDKVTRRVRPGDTRPEAG
ncbi:MULTISPECIES: DUF3560 domain-containing protein [Frankia]|nr:MULTISPECIES: DUF3560 domain-containing protein [Frankia]